jgi:hypothetical protein
MATLTISLYLNLFFKSIPCSIIHLPCECQNLFAFCKFYFAIFRNVKDQAKMSVKSNHIASFSLPQITNTFQLRAKNIYSNGLHARIFAR